MSNGLKKFCEGCRSIRPVSEFLKATPQTLNAPDLCRSCRRQDAHCKIIGQPIQTLQSAVDRFRECQEAIKQVEEAARVAAGKFEAALDRLRTHQTCIVETAGRIIKRHEIRIVSTGLPLKGGRVVRERGKIVIKIDLCNSEKPDDTNERKRIRSFYGKLYLNQKASEKGLKHT